VAFYHTLFALTVRSNVPIPGLLHVEAPAGPVDAEIYLETSPRAISETTPAPEELTYVSVYTDGSGSPGLRIWKTADGNYLHLLYYDGTQFWLQRQGREVWAVWPEASSLEDACSYLLGPVLGILLRLRGVTCLHASAVALNGEALAFVGMEGAGKSTTAAAFAREGDGVLSDDVVALHDNKSEFLVVPAYPHVCLWPESVAMLYGSADALPQFSNGWEKQRLSLGERETRFENRSIPLGAIYLLGERRSKEAPSVEAVRPQEALLSLVTDSFASKTLDREMRAREFEVLGRLVTCVPTRRVFAHRDGSRIHELCGLIREDFASVKESARTRH
jgi:hypothetical protein